MRIAYLQPVSGIAGNMLIGACLDAGVEWRALAAILEPLQLGTWEARIEQVVRHGVRGTYFDVVVDDPVYRPDHAEQAHHHGPHRKYYDILALVDTATHLKECVKRAALTTLERIGTVESQIHGIPLAELHLHELGAMDTIIDVVGAIAALDLLDIAKVYADPVHTGSGVRQTAHGLVPIPVPATAALLSGVPMVCEAMNVELATPTGAAILRTLLEESGTIGQTPLPFATLAIGHGAGSMDLPDRANLLRLIIGDTADVGLWERDRVVVLRTNVDDVPGERFPSLMAALLEAGALDVTVAPVLMKRGRPGHQIEVLGRPSDRDNLLMVLFREGITLGVRVEEVERAILPREMAETILPSGDRIPVKVAKLGTQVVSHKPEMQVIEEIAEQRGVPVREVLAEIEVKPNEYAEFDEVDYILARLKGKK